MMAQKITLQAAFEHSLFRIRMPRNVLKMNTMTFPVSVALRMAALGLSFFLSTTASAACYVDGASARISNYCALNKIQGARVDLRTVQFIDYKPKREGMQRRK